MSQTFSIERETRHGNVIGNLNTKDGVWVIRVDPVKAQTPEGSLSITMGFPVLMVTGWINDPEGFAKRVAELLTEHGA